MVKIGEPKLQLNIFSYKNNFLFFLKKKTNFKSSIFRMQEQLVTVFYLS